MDLARAIRSLIISLVSWLLSSLINDRGRVEVIDLKKGAATDGVRVY